MEIRLPSRTWEKGKNPIIKLIIGLYVFPMFIVLSQRIDTVSTYSDKIYSSYHYPARYKNQIHEGDTFIYYQGNRYVKEQRYYYGVGIVGKITSTDEDNYYATLVNVRRFEKKVPIYLSEGMYVEQLGFETVRNSPTPPWQSSIRPLSIEAYKYILENAGKQIYIQEPKSIDDLKESLKQYIRSFYLDNNYEAIIDIKNIASKIANDLNIPE